MGCGAQFRYLGHDQSGGTVRKRRSNVGMLANGTSVAEYTYLGTLYFYTRFRVFEKRRISVNERCC
ncbi:hypothetical protein D3C72_1274600 [compost metagenome]